MMPSDLPSPKAALAVLQPKTAQVGKSTQHFFFLEGQGGHVGKHTFNMYTRFCIIIQTNHILLIITVIYLILDCIQSHIFRTVNFRLGLTF